MSVGAALAVLLGLAWPVTAAPAQEQADQPIVRARLEPEGAVVVGEPVTLVVEVLTPTWFPRPPRFALPEVENAIAEEAPGSGFNLNERIGNASWAGLHREFRIFPQVPGEYVVPPATVQVVYALPDARPSDPLTLEAGELRFAANVWGRVAAWRWARADGEAARFARFRAAARSGDAGGTMRELVGWLDAWAGEGGPATLAVFAARAAEPKVTRRLDGLQAQAYGRSGPSGAQGPQPSSRVRA